MEDENAAAATNIPLEPETNTEELANVFGEQLHLDEIEQQTPDEENHSGAPLDTAIVADTNDGDKKTDEASDGEASEMDTIFGTCKQLALSKEFHGTLIGDPIFCPFLVLALTSDSESDVIRALEVFHLLALNPENSHGLIKVTHFFDGLKAASGNQKLPKEVRDFAQFLHDLVKESRKVPLKAQSRTKQNEIQGAVEPGSSTKKTERGATGKRNQSGTTGKAVLYVPLCIFKAKRLRMTEALLKLNGIISITYDLKKCQCLIRAKSHIPTELFGKSIANLGFECHLVTRVDNDEIMTKMEPDPKLDNSTSMYDKENWGAGTGRRSPQYLSDSDSETSFQEAQALAVPGNGDGAKEGKKSGWFSSAANFLQKSLYW